MSSWIKPHNNNRKRYILTPNIPLQSISLEKLKVYYITNVLVGGSFKYIQDLILSFPTISFIPITNIGELQKYSREFNSNHILLLQYLILSNISITNIIEIVTRTNIKLVIPIHDFYYFSPSTNDFTIEIHNSYLKSNVIPSEKLHLFNLAKHIIFPSNFVKNEYLKYFNISNYIVSSHIDYEVHPKIYIPPIKNKTINIALINELTECKGIEYYKELLKITNYNTYNINYHIFTGNKVFANYPNTHIHPRYKNEQIISLLYENNIHSILFLNKWGETYCYSLTHALRSSIPLLYSNIGAFTERIPNLEHYFPVNPDPTTKYCSLNSISDSFFKMLEYIIEKNESFPLILDNDSKHIIPDFYNKLFEN